MKKLFLSIFILSLISTFMHSQTISPLIVLDNYLIPQHTKGAIIGKVITSTGKEVFLKEDKSNLFTLDSNGYISLKSNVELTDNSPYNFEITIQTDSGEKVFELVKDNFIRNKVIAHRGAWKNHDASQNSLKSLKKAVEIGCEASEFDVWLSSDNKVVLSHDPVIDGKTVEETTAAELHKIAFKDGDYLPGLEEYIEYIKTQNKTRLVLEVKTSLKGKERCEAIADSAVQIVHRMKAQAWTDYITFNFDAAMRIRQLDPTAHILYLEADKSLAELAEAGISGIDYHFSHFFKDVNLIKNAKKKGLLTNVWTVNKVEDMQMMLKQGVDYITTDEPEILLELIK